MRMSSVEETGYEKFESLIYLQLRVSYRITVYKMLLQNRLA